jgi:S-adenosylmethionine decarboxylase proenzyme
VILIPPKPHLVIDFYGCDPERLDDCEGTKALLYEVAKGIGATVVGDIFHQFSPHGITGVLAIAESHISIHTWVEYRYAAVDLFMCNSNLTSAAVEAAVARISCFLKAASSSVTAIQRGAAPCR